MPNAEYYEVLEDWPQPTDEQGTLVSAAPATTTPHKKKKSTSVRRQRKKLSESLAGITAAAVTVVMVATAIPSLGDAFGDIQDDFDWILDPFPGLIAGEICPVCNRKCNFYTDGMPGLKITYEDGWDMEGQEADDLTSMLGFTQEDDIYMGHTGAVMTKDGRRVVLRTTIGMVDSMIPEDSSSSHYSYNNMQSDSKEPSYADVIYEWFDEESGDPHFLTISLAYFPDGRTREPDKDRLQERVCNGSRVTKLYTLCQDVAGVKGAQIQLATDVSGIDLEAVFPHVETEIIQDRHQTYDLGATMRLTENAELLRSYDDAAIWGRWRSFDYIYDGGEQPVVLHEDYFLKEYSLSCKRRGETLVKFTAVSWHKLFEIYQWLNAEAEETGHTVYFPVVELEEVTVNGITYSVYAYYTSQPVDTMVYPWIWYYYIPQQEDMVAIVDHWGIDADELQWVLENRQVHEAHIGMFREEVLNQITLR